MFIYFLQNKLDRSSLTATTKHLEELGLSHIAESPSDIIVRDIINGPGASIQAIANKHSIPNDSHLGYFADRQDVFEFENFAIGMIKGDWGPSAIERTDAIDSHPWQDWKGRSWKIPIAKRWESEDGQCQFRCALDRTLKVDRSGEWVFGDVLPKHRALWDLATDFFDRLAKAQKIAQDDQSTSYLMPSVELSDLCSIVFGANYRVSKYEMGAMEILRAKDQFEIMNLVIDMPGFALLQKKTA